MEYIAQNITTPTTTEIEISDLKLSYKTITLVNTANNPTLVVDLYLENRYDPAERFYILSGTQIPAATSLELGSTDLEYLNTSRKLMITSNSPTGDLTIFIRG
jgi:hypothetical protein